MKDFSKQILEGVKKVQIEISTSQLPPEEGSLANTQLVLPFSLVRNTRRYIEKIVNQINGAYEHGWYDACAVMIRRLIETLIIEVFEHYNISSKIQNRNGNFLYLNDLVRITISEEEWNLSRNTKNALPRLKGIGDLSAHGRRFIAHRNDIDKVIADLRIVVQELILLAELK